MVAFGSRTMIAGSLSSCIAGFLNPAPKHVWSIRTKLKSKVEYGILLCLTSLSTASSVLATWCPSRSMTSRQGAMRLTGQLELTETTRQAVDDYLDYLFANRHPNFAPHRCEANQSLRAPIGVRTPCRMTALAAYGSSKVVSAAPSSATKTAINSAGSVVLAFAETTRVEPGGSKNVCPTVNVSSGPPPSCE